MKLLLTWGKVALLPLIQSYKTELTGDLESLLPPTPLSGFIKKRLPQNGEEKGTWLYSGLCLASCQATGGQVALALPAATAMRLIYEFERLWTEIGSGSLVTAEMAQAINAGDALLALAHLSLLRSSLEAPRLLLAERLLNRACLELCQGQHLSRTSPQLKAHRRRIASCRAALFQACFGLGAFFGGEAKSWARIANFGRLLGLAFYLEDSSSARKTYTQALARLQGSTLTPAAQAELSQVAAWLLSREK